MIIKVPESGEISLDLFEKLIDISRVVTYTLEVTNKDNLKLQFFDKNGKIIKPYGDKNGQKSNKKVKKYSKTYK